MLNKKIDYIEGIHYRNKDTIRIEIEDGRINRTTQIKENKKHLPLIAPGLVDLQVNGYQGIDFNQIPFSENDVLKIVKLLAKQGITKFFPTLITNSDDSIQNALQTIVQACKSFEEVDNAIGGIHIEGPFISKEDGPRGAHNVNYVQKPNRKLFLQWQKIAEGKIKIITLSPEWENTSDFINMCVDSGVIVSIGHTSASPKQIAEAVKAGARLSTHLGNGAHLMLPRHPNYLWEQLAQDKLWATVIADSFHLPDSFLKVVFKMKPETSILISDCTQFAGLPSGTYQSHIGDKVSLSHSGRLYMTELPELLAGSARSLLWCINQLTNKKILSFEDAWDKASLKPMELLEGKTISPFQKGNKANLALLEQKNNKYEIIQTIVKGKDFFYAKRKKD